MSKFLSESIYRHRLVAKRLLASIGRWLPPWLFRPLRSAAERIAYSVRPDYQGETLPPIFHYWSARYVAPVAKRLNIHSPEQFYFAEICKIAKPESGPIRIISIGSGACSLEIVLAQRLIQEGIDFKITCIDFNAQLVDAAKVKASEASILQHINFLVRDCNQLDEIGKADAIIVNQFFHHVEQLESLCARLHETLHDSGVLITSDVVGRNGHLLWPDIAKLVYGFWSELPPEKRMDRYFNSIQGAYKQVDHSAYSNEGIRAQDVVGCLLKNFQFEIFFTFGGCIVPFIERRIGFNFDPEINQDTSFIDRVQAADLNALELELYPASNMIASLRKKGRAVRVVHYPVSPERHLAMTRAQLDLLGID